MIKHCTNYGNTVMWFSRNMICSHNQITSLRTFWQQTMTLFNVYSLDLQTKNINFENLIHKIELFIKYHIKCQYLLKCMYIPS